MLKLQWHDINLSDKSCNTDSLKKSLSNHDRATLKLLIPFLSAREEECLKDRPALPAAGWVDEFSCCTRCSGKLEFCSQLVAATLTLPTVEFVVLGVTVPDSEVLVTTLGNNELDLSVILGNRELVLDLSVILLDLQGS